MGGRVTLLFFLRNLILADVMAAGDFQASYLRGISGNPLPPIAMPLVNPTLAVAIEVAHFVEDGIAEVISGSVIVTADFDSDATPVTPVELAELTPCVGNRHLYFREGIAEN